MMLPSYVTGAGANNRTILGSYTAVDGEVLFFSFHNETRVAKMLRDAAQPEEQKW